MPKAIRLQGPLSRNGTGRVEVFYREHWVSICFHNWDINDAVVVCHQLGFKYGFRAFEERDSSSLGKIWLDDVNCTGNEPNLTSCSHHVRGSGNECQNGRFSLAAVECSSTGKIFIRSLSVALPIPINLIMYGACCLGAHLHDIYCQYIILYFSQESRQIAIMVWIPQ